MSTSFGGLISGLDTNTLIAQLVSIEARPITVLEKKKSAQNQLLAIYSDARTKLNALKTAAQAMDTAKEFMKVSATSSDEDIFTVNATSYAAAGEHTIKVLSLAQTEMEVSHGYAAITSSIGTGTFSVTVGSDVVNINVDSTNNTLEGLRDALNAAEELNEDGARLTASIINDGDASNPYRLVITSSESGTANAITINAGATGLTFTDGTNPEDPGQQAANATLLFDGVSVTKSSNEIDDLLSGVTINLHEVDTENLLTLKLENNIDEITEKIQTFIDAYNEFHTWVSSKKSAGSLKGDMALESMDRQLRNTISSTVEGLDNENFQALSQIGLSFDRFGTLSLNKEDFEDAIDGNYMNVMKLFSAYGSSSNSHVSVNSVGDNAKAGTYAVNVSALGDNFAATINGHAANVLSGNFFTGASGYDEENLALRYTGDTTGDQGSVTVSLGIMELIERQIKIYTDSVDGTIKGQEESINNRIKNYDRQIERKELSLEKYQARLKAKYTRMEMMLAQLQSQNSYLG